MEYTTESRSTGDHIDLAWHVFLSTTPSMRVTKNRTSQELWQRNCETLEAYLTVPQRTKPLRRRSLPQLDSGGPRIWNQGSPSQKISCATRQNSKKKFGKMAIN